MCCENLLGSALVAQTALAIRGNARLLLDQLEARVVVERLVVMMVLVVLVRRLRHHLLAPVHAEQSHLLLPEAESLLGACQERFDNGVRLGVEEDKTRIQATN